MAKAFEPGPAPRPEHIWALVNIVRDPVERARPDETGHWRETVSITTT